ncbi:radical SAM protein [bacterium]|nr:radical SAM protein [candidate division CSSED10-310 bacterium]
MGGFRCWWCEMKLTGMALQKRLGEAERSLHDCMLCPRACHVDRTLGERGFCGGGLLPLVHSACPHFGEEPPLVGSGGSGTIFFAGCNLGCVFCQNYRISHFREGLEVSHEELAGAMCRLARLGCHNINLVTPTHFIPQILAALALAWDSGLSVPIVYNCGGYESVDALSLLDGVVDVYMPDIKMFDPIAAERYCNAPDYGEAAKRAVREMRRQVGDLVLDGRGIASRGLLIRHLVMPGRVEDSVAVLDFIAAELGGNSYVNVMAQYRPLFKAADHPGIDREITGGEYSEVLRHAAGIGLVRGMRDQWRDRWS